MRFGVIMLVCLLMFSGAPFVHAQYSTEEDPITVNIFPTYPRPYQTITITPHSTLLDLTASAVTISVNGTVIQKGTGTQEASVQVGGPGEVTNITVSVATPDGKTTKSTLSVRPADVALIIEPTSSAHPFYTGLPLVAPQARVRLVAIPDLRSSAKVALDPSKLVYTWKLGDQVLQSASGVGRSVLIATAPVRYRDADITLTVTSPDSSLVAQAFATVSPVDPIVRIYADDPLKGPDFDHALSGVFTLLSAEATFRAVPYYFGSSPAFEWSVNNTAQSAQRTVTVRSTGSGKGTASLDIRAKLADSIQPQSANSRISLQFGESKSPLSIFGF